MILWHTCSQKQQERPLCNLSPIDIYAIVSKSTVQHVHFCGFESESKIHSTHTKAGAGSGQKRFSQTAYSATREEAESVS